MKIQPLSKSNVSESRFPAFSPSLKTDYRGYPHITWVEGKNGHNTINYKTWDGLHWAMINNNPVVYKTDDEIVSGNNNIIIDKDSNPFVVFGRKSATGSSIGVSSHNNEEWNTVFTNVNYEIKWIGCLFATRDIEDWSSSSEIFSSSTSSESSGSSLSLLWSSSSLSSVSSEMLSSESSHSSLTSISSSSLVYSSSSVSSSSLSSSSRSSLSSSTSSSTSSSSRGSSNSSSSDMDYNIYVVVIDTNNNIYVYKYGNGVAVLYAQRNVGEFAGVKIATCGERIGYLTYGDKIKYNFYHPEWDSWSFSTDLEFSNFVNVSSVDIVGTHIDESIMIAGISCYDYAGRYVKVVKLDSNGNQYASLGAEEIVLTGAANEVSCNGFSVNMPKNVHLAYDETAVCPLCMFVGGGQNTVYTVSDYELNEFPLQISGSPYEFKANDISMEFKANKLSVAVGCQNDVYYYEGEINQQYDTSFALPKMAIFNSQRPKIGEINDNLGEFEFSELSCVWDTQNADILREANKKVIVFPDEGNDPDCTPSSSSLSLSTDSTSSASLSSDEVKCLLTWILRYDCEDGWTIRPENKTGICMVYDKDIVVNKWVEIGRLQGDYIEWKASKWGADCYIENEFDESSLSILTSFTESSVSPDISSESTMQQVEGCWLLSAFALDDYPRPTPNIPAGFACDSSSSGSSSSDSSSTDSSLSSLIYSSSTSNIYSSSTSDGHSDSSSSSSIIKNATSTMPGPPPP